MRRLIVAVFLIVSCVARALADPPPIRVWDNWKKEWVAPSALPDSLAGEDVVFVGEQHDDGPTHGVEAWLFAAMLARRKTDVHSPTSSTVALGLEMFERDVQVALDDYLAGRIDEATFLARSRPWLNYAAAYRPLVEAARAAHVDVVATNVPRRLAAEVAKEGMSALAGIPADQRWLFARHTTSPKDEYWRKFSEAMHQHTGVESMARYYAAQCLKDDTMAESIADYFERHRGAKVLLIHVNGAFHTDDGLGAFARTRERMPEARIATVRVIPLSDVAQAAPSKWQKTADWLIFVQSHGAANGATQRP